MKRDRENYSGGNQGGGPELLTLKQVAHALKVCVKTVRRLVAAKDIPIVRVGRQIRIRGDHLGLFTAKEW